MNGTAGSVAFPLAVDDPLELFPLHLAESRGVSAVPIRKLHELAKTIRSKNAGVDKITFDVIFRDRDTYDAVLRAHVLTRETIAALYYIADSRSPDFVEYDSGCAIKFAIYRDRPSVSPGDPDIFGAQQYAPLLDIEAPITTM